VIKGGRVVVRERELVDGSAGRLLRVAAAYDPGVEDVLRTEFEERYSVRFESYPVREPWLLEPALRVPAGRRG
jgi:formylmethanofuran dehydrogenase subunit A